MRNLGYYAKWLWLGQRPAEKPQAPGSNPSIHETPQEALNLKAAVEEAQRLANERDYIPEQKELTPRETLTTGNRRTNMDSFRAEDYERNSKE